MCFKRRPKPYPVGVHEKVLQCDCLDDAMTIFAMVAEQISTSSGKGGMGGLYMK